MPRLIWNIWFLDDTRTSKKKSNCSRAWLGEFCSNSSSGVLINWLRVHLSHLSDKNCSTFAHGCSFLRWTGTEVFDAVEAFFSRLTLAPTAAARRQEPDCDSIYTILSSSPSFKYSNLHVYTLWRWHWNWISVCWTRLVKYQKSNIEYSLLRHFWRNCVYRDNTSTDWLKSNSNLFPVREAEV